MLTSSTTDDGGAHSILYKHLHAERLAVFLLNLLALDLAAFIAFRYNIDRLFFHYDGSYAIIDIFRQRGAHHGPFELWSSVAEGLGTFQFGVNLKLFPLFWPIFSIADLETAKICVYLLMTSALFGATYATARIFSISRAVARLGGWLICVLAFPMLPRGFFYEIFSIAPPFLLIPLTGPFVLATLLTISTRRLLLSGCACAILFALTACLLAVSPMLVVPIVLGAIPYVMIAIALSTSRQELTLRLAVVGVIGAIALLLRWPWYLYGLFGFTAANFYTADFISPYSGDPQYISLLFQGPVLNWPGPALVILAMAGAVFACFQKDKRFRIGAYALIGFWIVVLLGARVAFALVSSWILPPPIYLEIALWPLYASYAAFAVYRIIGAAGGTAAPIGALGAIWFGDVRTGTPRWLVPPISLAGTLASAVRGVAHRFGHHRLLPRQLQLVLAGVVAVVALAYSRAPTQTIYTPPFSKPPIVDTLARRIAISDGGRFEGRVATIFAVIPKSTIDPWDEGWLQQIAQAGKILTQTRNDHFSTGLWWYGIPTLLEYNQFTSPTLHALKKLSLTQTPYPQQRNVTIFTRANEKIFELLGVRYVITPSSVTPVGIERQTETIEGGTLRLSELSSPNLGTYSPTIIERQGDVRMAIARLATEDFDPKTTVISDGDLSGSLVPMAESAIFYDGEDLRITAHSAGRSLIVVPREYSHCLELSSSAPTKATLHRVNGLLTGILFEQRLDAILAFRIGPFHNPMCRYQDLRDFDGQR